jgi:hypothetical protein
MSTTHPLCQAPESVECVVERARVDLDDIEYYTALWISCVRSSLDEIMLTAPEQSFHNLEASKLTHSEDLYRLIRLMKRFCGGLICSGCGGRDDSSSDDLPDNLTESGESCTVPGHTRTNSSTSEPYHGCLSVHSCTENIGSADHPAILWPHAADAWQRYSCTLHSESADGPQLRLTKLCTDGKDAGSALTIPLSAYAFHAPADDADAASCPPPCGFFLSAAAPGATAASATVMRGAAALLGTLVPGARSLLGSLQVRPRPPARTRSPC